VDLDQEMKLLSCSGKLNTEKKGLEWSSRFPGATGVGLEVNLVGEYAEQTSQRLTNRFSQFKAKVWTWSRLGAKENVDQKTCITRKIYVGSSTQESLKKYAHSRSTDVFTNRDVLPFLLLFVLWISSCLKYVDRTLSAFDV
jgi:hypothetical protein